MLLKLKSFFAAQLVAKAKPTKRCTRSSVAKDVAKQVAQVQVSASLTAKHKQLKSYAASLNLSLVSIRLDEARNAAEKADQQRFESLAHGIWRTLEDQYQNIATARQDLLVPNFLTRTSPAESSIIAEVQGESQISIFSVNSQ